MVTVIIIFEDGLYEERIECESARVYDNTLRLVIDRQITRNIPLERIREWTVVR